MKKSIFMMVVIVSAIINSALANRIYVDENGLAIVIKSIAGQMSCGLIDLKGNTIIPFMEYDLICGFKDGMAKVRKDDRYGYINMDGNLVIPPKYDFARAFNGNYALVRQGDSENGKYHTINKKGEIVHTFSDDINWGREDYIQELAMDDGFVVFALQGESYENKWYLINHFGKTISDAIFDNPFDYDGMDGGTVSNDGMSNADIIIVSKASLHDDEGNLISHQVEGAINLEGQTIVPLSYSSVLPVGMTLAANKNFDYSYDSDRNPENWERYNLKGEKISIPNSYILAPYNGDPTKDYFPAYSKKTKRMGILNKEGKEITNFKYYKITDPDKYGICIAFIGDINEDEYNWYDPDRYHPDKVDIIFLNDRTKDRLNIPYTHKGDVIYNDGIMISRQDGKHVVTDILIGKELYTLNGLKDLYSLSFNHDITVSTERIPQSEKYVINMRNRTGEIIYTLEY